MPYTDYGFLDPLHIVWREGTPNDPYIHRSESMKVVNQTLVLQEIPDKVYRVNINGYKEINYETLTNIGIKPNEFHVNYSTGIILFHADAEAKTITVVYKGRGFIQYPADRIYYQDKFNNVIYSLKNIIENSNHHLEEIDFRFKELEGILEKAEVAINQTEDVIDDANEATEDAIVATELALEAYETTKLVFKQYVNTFSDINTLYPNPQVGWTVSVYDTGERFRYDGISWVAIDVIGGNVPEATELSSGLMSKEQFKKLRDISDYTDIKIMTFVIPEDILNGIQSPKLSFELDGIITEVKAFVGTKGLEDTPIDVQVSTDYENWSSILDSPMLIEGGNYEDNKLHTVINDVVAKENKYRITVNTFVADARDLQVIIKALID